VVAGSQKALMTPPGLGFVSVSERAMRMHEGSTMPRYYFDWAAAQKAYAKEPAQTAWTPPVSLIIQLDIALQQLLEEGVENVFERHVLLGRAARAGVKGMGLSLFGPDEDLNSAVTAAWVPEGIDGKRFVTMLFREHGIQVAGGQGEMAGKIFRIGHCGYFDAYDIVATIAAAELALETLDYPVELGRGVGAAQRVFSKSGVAA
jgi:serine---pyruvate transaminase